MTTGILEVTLHNARDLKDNIFLGGMDAYVALQYKNQKHKSKSVKGNGGNPVWNEKFWFEVDTETDSPRDHHKLILKLMDRDLFSANDHLGQATLYLKEVVQLGLQKGSIKLPPTKYVVVDRDNNYSGEVQVSITVISSSSS